MDWNQMDDKMKRRQDANFVSCEERYELDYIKKALKECGCSNTDAEIDAAITACCEQVPAPRPREKYLACLKSKLS